MESLIDKSWLFEVVDNKTRQIIKSFTLVIPPTQVQIREPQRVNPIRTFGELFVDDYGPDNIDLTIRGISGTARAFPTFCTEGVASLSGNIATALAKQQGRQIVGIQDGYDQRSAFYTFRDNIMRYKDQSGDFTNKELHVYDLYDSQGYNCVLLSFLLDRNAQTPFRYPFTISLLVKERLDSKSRFKPKKMLIVADPFELISGILDVLNYAVDLVRDVQEITNNLFRIQAFANQITTRLNQISDGVLSVIPAAVSTAAQAVAATENLRASLTNAFTLNRISTDTYVRMLETTSRMSIDSARVHQYIIAQGFQVTRRDSVSVATNKTDSDAIITNQSGIEDLPIGESESQYFEYSGTVPYTVRQGDTLLSIALAFYGDENLWPFIAQLNDIKDALDIPAGYTLMIPISTQSSISQIDLTKDSFILSEDLYRDPYGQDLLLKNTGTKAVLVAAESGDLVTTSGINSVVQKIDVTLNTRVSSMIKETFFGLLSSIGSANSAAAYSYLTMNFRNALLLDPRITEVTNINITAASDTIYAGADIFLVGREESLPVSTTF